MSDDLSVLAAPSCNVIAVMAPTSHMLGSSTSDKDPSSQHRELADSLWQRYESDPTADAAVLDEVIEATQNAVNLQPSDTGDPELYFQLGLRLKTRFKLDFDMADLDRLISAYQRAVELTADGDPSQIVRLIQLGVSYFKRFGLNGDVLDLDGAMLAMCCVVELTPDIDSLKPEALNNYAASMQARYKISEDPEDLDCYISALRHAVKLTPDDHPALPMYLHDFGNSLLKSFAHRKDLAVLEKAIEVHRRIQTYARESLIQTILHDPTRSITSRALSADR